MISTSWRVSFFEFACNIQLPIELAPDCKERSFVRCRTLSYRTRELYSPAGRSQKLEDAWGGEGDVWGGGGDVWGGSASELGGGGLSAEKERAVGGSTKPRGLTSRGPEAACRRRCSARWRYITCTRRSVKCRNLQLVPGPGHTPARQNQSVLACSRGTIMALCGIIM